MSEIATPAPIPAPVNTNEVVVTGLSVAAAVTINEITVDDSNIFYSDGTDLYWNGRVKIGTTTGVLYNSVRMVTAHLVLCPMDTIIILKRLW